MRGVGVGALLSLSGIGREVGWAGRLLTFSAFRMGVYLRWALNGGWALIRISTVFNNIDPFICKSVAAYIFEIM